MVFVLVLGMFLFIINVYNNAYATSTSSNKLELVKNDVSLTHACSYYKLYYSGSLLNWMYDIATIQTHDVRQVYGNLTDLTIEWLVNESYNVSVADYGTCYFLREINKTNLTCSDIGCLDYNKTHCNCSYTCIKGYHNETRYKQTWYPVWYGDYIKKEFEQYASELNKHGSMMFKEVESKGYINLRWCGNYKFEQLPNGSWGVAIDHIPEFKSQAYYKFTWWNSSWQYRKPITITEQSGNNLTNFQVAINVSYDSDMQSDFDDLRFTYYNATSDTETEIPYWIESYSASNWCYVWVNVTYIPANDNATIYMYYSNTEASNESNGDNTFILFDDFEGSDIDTSKWVWEVNGDASYSVTNSYIEIAPGSSGGNGGRIKRTAQDVSDESDFIIETKALGYWAGVTDKQQTMNIGFTEATQSVSSYGMSIYREITIFKTNAEGTNTGYYRIDLRSADASNIYAAEITDRHINESTWYIFRLRNIYSNTNFDFYILNTDYTQVYYEDYQTNYGSGVPSSVYDSISDNRIYLACGEWNNLAGAYARYDWVRVRKYADPEPTYTIGSEETPTIITIHSPQNTTYTTTTIWLNVTADETVNTWLYNLNNAGNTSFTPNITLGKNEGLQQGQNYITVWANDTAGNWNSLTVYFTINATSNITIYIYQPQNITYNTSNQVSLKFEAIVSNTFEDNYHIKAYMDNINIYNNNSYTGENVSICYFGYSNEQSPVTTCTASNCYFSTSYSYDNNVYDCSSSSHAMISTYASTSSMTYPSGYAEAIKSVIYNMIATPQSEVNIYWRPSGHYYDHDGTSKSIVYVYNYNSSTWDKKVEYSWSGYAPLMSQTTTKIQLNESYVNNKIAKIKIEGQDKVYAGLQSYQSTHDIYIYYIKLTATPPLGQNNVTIWINDTDTLNPNTAEQTRYFTMSYLVPTINITSPLNKTYSTSSIALTISATNYYKILYSLNGGSNTTYTGSTTITAVPGQNNITAWAINEWGNTSSQIVYFSHVAMSISPESYEYTIQTNQSEIFNITVSHNADVARVYNISCYSGSACTSPNFTISFTPPNVTIDNSTDTEDFKVNITSNSSPAGTYYAILRIWMIGEQIWKEFNTTIHIAEQPGDIYIINPTSYVLSKYTDETFSISYNVSNEGLGLLKYCNASLDGDFVGKSFYSFSLSNFNLSAGESKLLVITFANVPAGSYNTDEGLQIECVTAGGVDTLSPDNRPTISLTTSERPSEGGGGGGGIIGAICGNGICEEGETVSSCPVDCKYSRVEFKLYPEILEVGIYPGTCRSESVVLANPTKNETTLITLTINSTNWIKFIDKDGRLTSVYTVELLPNAEKEIRMQICVDEATPNGFYNHLITIKGSGGVVRTIKVRVGVGMITLVQILRDFAGWVRNMASLTVIPLPKTPIKVWHVGMVVVVILLVVKIFGRGK